MSDLFSNIAQKIQEIYEKHDDDTDMNTRISAINTELREPIDLVNQVGAQLVHGFIPPELVREGIVGEDDIKQYIVSAREGTDPDYGKMGGHDWLQGMDKNPTTDIKLTNEEIMSLEPTYSDPVQNKEISLKEAIFVKDSDGNIVHSVEKFEGDSFRFNLDGQSCTGLDVYRLKLEMVDGKNGYLMFTADNIGNKALTFQGDYHNVRDITDEKSVNLSSVYNGDNDVYIKSLDMTGKWEKSPSESEEAFKDRVEDFKTRYTEAANDSYDKWYDHCTHTDGIRQENIADRKVAAHASEAQDDVLLGAVHAYKNILNAEVVKASDKLKNLIVGTGGFNDVAGDKTETEETQKAAVVKEIASATQEIYTRTMAVRECTDNTEPLKDYRAMLNITSYDLTGPTDDDGNPVYKDWANLSKERDMGQIMDKWQEIVDARNSLRHDLTSNANPMRYDEALENEKMMNERDRWTPMTPLNKVTEIMDQLSIRVTPLFTPTSDEMLPQIKEYIKDVCMPYIRDAVEKFNADKEPDMQVTYNEETGELEGNKESIKELTEPESEFGKDKMPIEEFIAFPFTLNDKGEKQKVEMSEDDKAEVSSVILFARDLVHEGKDVGDYSAKDLIENNRGGSETDTTTMDETPVDEESAKKDESSNDDASRHVDKSTSVTSNGNTNDSVVEPDDENTDYDFVPITTPIYNEDGTVSGMRNVGTAGKVTSPANTIPLFGIAVLHLALLGPFGFITLGAATASLITSSVMKDKEQKENADLELVKQDGTLIKYIEKPTEKVTLTAINQNPNAILNIKDPTEKAMIRAFGKDGTLVTKVDDKVLTEKAVISAVTNSPDTVKDLPEHRVTDNVREAADSAKERQVGMVTENPESIGNFKNPCADARQVVVDKRPDIAVKEFGEKLTDEQQVSIVSKEPKLAEDMPTISQPAQSKLVDMDSKNFRLITNPSEQTKMELVGKDGINIRMVANPSENVMRAAIQENPTSVVFIKNPPENIIKEALSKDGMVAEKLDKSLLTKEAMMEAVKNAPDLENSKVIDKSLITDEIKAVAKEAREDQCKTIEKNPDAIADMKNPCKAARDKAIEISPDAAAKGIKNPTQEEKLAIIEKRPSSAVYFEKQDQITQSKLAENIDNYKYIKEPTVVTKSQYVINFPEKIKDVYGDNPPKSVVERVVSKDPANLKYIDKPSWDVVKKAIDKDAKSVALNAKPGTLAIDHKIMIAGKAGDMIGTPAMREGGIPETAARVAMTGKAKIPGKEVLHKIFDGLTPEQCKTAIDNKADATENIVRQAIKMDSSAITEVKDPDLRLALINEYPPLIADLSWGDITPTDAECKAVACRLHWDEVQLPSDVTQRVKEEEQEIIDKAMGVTSLSEPPVLPDEFNEFDPPEMPDEPPYIPEDNPVDEEESPVENEPSEESTADEETPIDNGDEEAPVEQKPPIKEENKDGKATDDDEKDKTPITKDGAESPIERKPEEQEEKVTEENKSSATKDEQEEKPVTKEESQQEQAADDNAKDKTPVAKDDEDDEKTPITQKSDEQGTKAAKNDEDKPVTAKDEQTEKPESIDNQDTPDSVDEEKEKVSVVNGNPPSEPLTDEENPVSKVETTKKEDETATDIVGSATGTPPAKPEDDEGDKITKVPETSENKPTSDTDEEMESSKVGEDSTTDAERDNLESRTEEEARKAMEEQSQIDNQENNGTTTDTQTEESNTSDSLPTVDDYYLAATSYEDKDSLEGFIMNLSESFAALGDDVRVEGFNDVIDSITQMTEMFMDDNNGMNDITFGSALQDICDAASQIFTDNGLVNNEDAPYDTGDILDIVMNELKQEYQDDPVSLDRLEGLQSIINDTDPVTVDDVSAKEAAEANTAAEEVTSAATEAAIDKGLNSAEPESLITQDDCSSIVQKMLENGITSPSTTMDMDAEPEQYVDNQNQNPNEDTVDDSTDDTSIVSN